MDVITVVVNKCSTFRKDSLLTICHLLRMQMRPIVNGGGSSLILKLVSMILCNSNFVAFYYIVLNCTASYDVELYSILLY